MDVYSAEIETLEKTRDVARRAERHYRLHPEPGSAEVHSERRDSVASSLSDRIRARLQSGSVALVGALLVVYIVWGSTYMAIRIAIDSIPPMLMASIRFLIAGSVLYAFAIRRGDRTADRPTPRTWLSALLIGGLMLAGGNGGVTWAEQHISSGLAALLVASVPLWITVFAHFAGMERLRGSVLVGIVVGLAGVAILTGGAFAAPGELAGTAVVVGASITWAIGSLYAKRAPLPRRPLVGVAMEMLAGGVVMLAIAAAGGELGRVHLELVTWKSLLALAYLVVFGSILAFTAYIWLLNNARSSIAGTYAFVNPAIAVGFGAVFLGEAVSPRLLAGGAVIVVAVALIVTAGSAPWPRLRRAQAQNPTAECSVEAA